MSKHNSKGQIVRNEISPISSRSWNSEKSKLQRKSTPYNICFPLISSEDVLSKILIAKKQYDYYSSSDLENKQTKQKCLHELLEMMQNDDFKSVLANLSEQLMEMIQLHTSITLPPRSKVVFKIFTDKQDEPVIYRVSDPRFDQTKTIYEILLKIVKDDYRLSEYITQAFVEDLVALLDSQVVEERVLVSDILVEIYDKYVNKRKIMRNIITQTFQNMVYDNSSFNGAKELLDMYSYIIMGFAVPLKRINLDFFTKVLLPLHKVENLSGFYTSLINCCLLYISKENTLASNLIEYLMKYMPFGNSSKAEIFLYEMYEVFSKIDLDSVDSTLFVKLCKRLVRIINEASLPIAIKALSLINNNCFLNLLINNKSQAAKMFYPALDSLFQRDTFEEYYEFLTLVEYKLSKVDQENYELFLKKKDVDGEEHENKNDNKGKWARFEELAKEKCNVFSSTTIPYDENSSLTAYSDIYHKFAYKTNEHKY